MKIQVNLKSMGKRRQSVEPVCCEIQGRPSTVRELICAVTEAGVQEYNQRMEASDILSYLTKGEIDDRAAAGKISFVVNYGEHKADLRKAQENALQCFADGIYRIFLDEKSLEDLDEIISIRDDSVFTFVRLTMLAGRMW